MSKENFKQREAKEISENKKEVINWIKAHKKLLVFMGIGIPTLIAFVLGIKNKDILQNLLQNIKEEIRKGNLYSSKWFETATDRELDLEREKVRLAYCSSGDDFYEACRYENLLRMFDKELNKRAWGDDIPHASSIHREHGRYLPNDD